jgi:restriction system protein
VACLRRGQDTINYFRLDKGAGGVIPDYQTLMLPLQKYVSDGKEYRVADMIAALADNLALTEAEKSELLPSGKQTVISNRAHWAKTYMAQAKLLEITRHAHFRITERGREVLRQNPSRIDNQLLNQFPEFQEFKARGHEGSQSTTPPTVDIEPPNKLATPDEVLRTTVADLDAVLASELLDRILAAPPSFFENLIVNLLLTMGYGGSREEAGKAIGRSGDGGIDGVIDQDPLGLDRVYLQAKRYKSDAAISEPEIRAFSGSLGAAKANKGVFVTTSYFTKPALEFAERHPFKMVLIDGKQLTALMIRHNVGVRIAETMYLKKVDEDFFGEE